MLMCMHACMHAGTQRGQERASDHRKVVKGYLSCLAWMLGIELRSSRRIIGDLNS